MTEHEQDWRVVDEDWRMCKHCGGPKEIRNPTGYCDHLYWPDMLTDEAKRANGYVPVQRTLWEKVSA